MMITDLLTPSEKVKRLDWEIGELRKTELAFLKNVREFSEQAQECAITIGEKIAKREAIIQSMK